MEILDTILGIVTLFGDELLAAAGRSPFAALGYIMTHGGLILFFPLMVWMLWMIWIFYVVGEYVSKQRYVLLAVDVPAVNEQSMRAVEQMLVALHGVLFNYNKKDLFWHGMQIEPFSLEIVSIEGYIQYFIWTNTRYVDLVKAAVYAQYPDAEIVEVEDYASNVPSNYPDDEYGVWGTELQFEKSSAYPIKTYEFFEHSLTGSFADPMASILEQLSRLKPGEQAWLQLVITPQDGSGIRNEGMGIVQQLIGADPGYSPGAVEKLVFGSLDAAFNAAAPASFEKGDTPVVGRDAESGNFMSVTTGERVIIEEIQKKVTQLQFDTKFRFVYIGKKQTFDRFRVAGGVFGALKQFNSLDLNSFKNGPFTTTSRPTYFFWQRRRHIRETKLVQSYQGRSNWNGENPITMSTSELATLFHFPLESAQAPLLSTTESKKAEPPTRLPQNASTRLPVPPEPGEEEGGAPAELPVELGDVPRGRRIPKQDEALRPAAGIPASITERLDVNTEKPLAQSMKGLPPGVKPVDGGDWKTLDEWSLEQRSKLDVRDEHIHHAERPMGYVNEPGPFSVLGHQFQEHKPEAKSDSKSELEEKPEEPAKERVSKQTIKQEREAVSDRIVTPPPQEHIAPVLERVVEQQSLEQQRQMSQAAAVNRAQNATIRNQRTQAAAENPEERRTASRSTGAPPSGGAPPPNLPI